MSKTEKMTKRVTVKMDANLKAKLQYEADRRIVGYHGYQSFKPGELTPEEFHRIGVLTAKQMWGDRFEVIVATQIKGSSF